MNDYFFCSLIQKRKNYACTIFSTISIEENGIKENQDIYNIIISRGIRGLTSHIV